MIHKTKAAMQGRQCHYQKLKQSQDTRVNAGGQSLSAPVIAGTAPLARFGGMSKSGHSRQGYTIFSAHLQTTHKLCCLGYTALAHTPFPQIWGDLDKRAGSTAMQHTPEISRSFDRYPDIGYHSLSASLAFLRWRRLISPMAAVIRKPAVLSPLFFTDSISSNTSCGTRTFTCFDLLFTEPVAITDSPRVWCYSLYAKKNHIQYLTCYAPSNKVNSTLIKPRHKNGNASECGNTTEASNHNVRWSNIMACIQHTQTRPEFTWRFLSASERYPTAKPLVIYVNASSEREARDTMPGVTLIFAARLPFHAFQMLEVRHV
ncbi:hypothetical protein C3E93_06025 [Klebsiella pneumoniae]|nr:hypothetical protein C3E93_06025 [Klebsiella pneumoniae]HBZ2206187.1 host cell division inhibitor Icd-like protein [Klebsiella pneumoniae]HBZ5582803.1 host cell division inhibitor Icd-like protein [Klebsiella pneumoniae]